MHSPTLAWLFDEGKSGATTGTREGSRAGADQIRFGELLRAAPADDAALKFAGTERQTDGHACSPGDSRFDRPDARKLRRARLCHARHVGGFVDDFAVRVSPRQNVQWIEPSKRDLALWRGCPALCHEHDFDEGAAGVKKPRSGDTKLISRDLELKPPLRLPVPRIAVVAAALLQLVILRLGGQR